MKTVAITSGKGGVGKTSTSINLAVALAESGQRVVLFDADLQLANVDVALGLKPQHNLQHVVSGEKSLDEVTCRGPAGVRIISGGSAVSSLMTAGPQKMAIIAEQLHTLTRSTDILIFDTAAGLDHKVIRFWKLAEEIVLITTPDPTSVTDAYATIKLANKRLKESCIRVLVNQVSNEGEALAVYRTLENISAAFLEHQIDYLGSIRYDYNAAVAVRKKEPYILASPGSWASADVRRVADRLVRPGSPRADLFAA